MESNNSIPSRRVENVSHGNDPDTFPLIFSGKNPNIFVEDERTNVASTIITITQDKLENILLKHNKPGGKLRWAVPLPVFLSIFLTLLTTSGFKDCWGLSAAVWTALFHLVGIIFLLWTVVEFFLLYRRWKDLSLESLINKIKGG